MHASKGSSGSCFPKGHKEQFNIVIGLITSQICSKMCMNKLLRIMISAYDMYKLFIYIVVSHFTLHQKEQNIRLFVYIFPILSKSRNNQIYLSILLDIKNIFASNYEALFHSQKTWYLGCRVSLCNWSSKRQRNFVILILKVAWFADLYNSQREKTLDDMVTI